VHRGLRARHWLERGVAGRDEWECCGAGSQSGVWPGAMEWAAGVFGRQ